MAATEYGARAAELHAQAKLEQDPEVAEMLETVASCFDQLADTPAIAVEFFEFPRGRLFPRDPFKK